MTAILSFTLLLVLTLASLATVEGADTPPASGTWTIDIGETVTHSGTTIDLRGDLHVRGTLELDNSTLWVWLDASNPRELVIHPGGELLLTNTAVASQDMGRAYVLQAEDGSVLHLDRSSIWRAGDRLTTDGRASGIHVATDDATIRDTVFMECLVGLWVTAADVELADCDFVDCRYGAVVDAGGHLTIDRAYILRCTIGALSNASMMTVRDSLVTGCEEGVLAYGGNLTVARTDVSNCSIVGIGGYSAEATILECTIYGAEADGVVIHDSRAWISMCTFSELDTDVKVIHSVASLVANHHKNTLDEAMWMYHSTFHVRDVVTEDSYWGLKCWKSSGVCLNLTTINATFGAYIERCEDVTLEGLLVDQRNRTLRPFARGIYVTGGSFALYNATIRGVRTGIDMLSATGVARWVRIDDCYQDGVMVSLSWFYTLSDINVTRADDGYWLNLYSGGRLERCVASLCRTTGFNITAGATTRLVECNSSANPVGVSVMYASPVLLDCEMFMCDDRWQVTNETLGMELFFGAPRIIGGRIIGGFGGIRLNDTRALVDGVTFTNVDSWCIQIKESTGDTISNCNFVNNINATAVFVWKARTVILDNWFYHNNYGITGADNSHLVIEGNTIENITYDGVWIVANSTASFRDNLIQDIGFYGIHVMYYSSVTSTNDVIRDAGTPGNAGRGVFVWKASNLTMSGGTIINCSTGVYAFDAIDVTVSFTEMRDQNRGIVAYKDKSSNALAFVQHVRVVGCYMTNHSSFAVGVFDVNLTVVDCNFLDNIAAMHVNNATVDILDSSMVGSWLFGLRAEGSSHVKWTVQGRCRILSSDMYGDIDLLVDGGDLIMDDVLVIHTGTSSFRSTPGSHVAIHGCEWRADGAVIRLRGSDVELRNTTFTGVGPILGSGPGNLGITVIDGDLDVYRCTFRRTRTGLSLIGSNATITNAQFSECGEAGIYAMDSDVKLVDTRINRTMVGDAIHLDSSTLQAIHSSATIGVNGLVMVDSAAELYNCSLGGASTHCLSVNASTLVLMNTTYQSDRLNVMTGGVVEVWWLLTARVVWPNPEELTSATVWVSDVTGEEVVGGRPDAGGTVRWMPVLTLLHQDVGDSVHGPHTVYADLFGYTVSVTIELTSSSIVLLHLKDLDPPVFEMLGPLESELWSRTAALTIFGQAVDTGSGTDEVRVYTNFNPTSLRSNSETFSFKVTLSDGRHIIALKATDMAGNVATYTFVVWVETDPLVMSPPEPGDGTLTLERSVTLGGRLSRVEGVTVRVNRVLATIDGANRSYIVTMDLIEGANGYSILVEDWYGHQTWWNLTITADWTAPDLLVTSPLSVNTTDEWVEITGTVDADAKLFIQGSLVLLQEGRFSVKYPVYVGETALKVRAEDDIGNHRERDVFVYRREVSVEPPGPDPWEVYSFLIIIPIMMMVVYVVLRRIEFGGEEG